MDFKICLQSPLSSASQRVLTYMFNWICTCFKLMQSEGLSMAHCTLAIANWGIHIHFMLIMRLCLWFAYISFFFSPTVKLKILIMTVMTIKAVFVLFFESVQSTSTLQFQQQLQQWQGRQNSLMVLNFSIFIIWIWNWKGAMLGSTFNFHLLWCCLISSLIKSTPKKILYTR